MFGHFTTLRMKWLIPLKRPVKFLYYSKLQTPTSIKVVELHQRLFLRKLQASTPTKVVGLYLRDWSILIKFQTLTCEGFILVNPLSANPTKWSNTLKQLVGSSSTNYLSVFDHFVELTLNVLRDLALVSLLAPTCKRIHF